MHCYCLDKTFFYDTCHLKLFSSFISYTKIGTQEPKITKNTNKKTKYKTLNKHQSETLANVEHSLAYFSENQDKSQEWKYENIK